MNPLLMAQLGIGIGQAGLGAYQAFTNKGPGYDSFNRAIDRSKQAERLSNQSLNQWQNVARQGLSPQALSDMTQAAREARTIQNYGVGNSGLSRFGQQAGLQAGAGQYGSAMGDIAAKDQAQYLANLQLRDKAITAEQGALGDISQEEMQLYNAQAQAAEQRRKAGEGLLGAGMNNLMGTLGGRQAQLDWMDKAKMQQAGTDKIYGGGGMKEADAMGGGGPSDFGAGVSNYGMGDAMGGGANTQGAYQVQMPPQSQAYQDAVLGQNIRKPFEYNSGFMNQAAMQPPSYTNYNPFASATPYTPQYGEDWTQAEQLLKQQNYNNQRFNPRPYKDGGRVGGTQFLQAREDEYLNENTTPERREQILRETYDDGRDMQMMPKDIIDKRKNPQTFQNGGRIGDFFFEPPKLEHGGAVHPTDPPEYDLMSKVLSQRNKHLNWVERGLNPDNYPKIINKEGGKVKSRVINIEGGEILVDAKGKPIKTFTAPAHPALGINDMGNRNVPVGHFIVPKKDAKFYSEMWAKGKHKDCMQYLNSLDN
jgi:hypothetical protein